MHSIAFALLLFVTTVASAAAQEAPISLRPGDGAPYFVLEAAAGSTRAAELLVLNPGDAPVAVDLRAVDARTGPSAGAVYADREADQVGGWIALPVTRLTLPAGSTTRIPFEVRVPGDARPGHHLGGIVGAGAAARPSLEPAPAASREGQFHIATLTRVVIAVAVSVPGALTRDIAVDRLSTGASGPEGPYLQIDLRNAGNTLARPRGLITLRDGGGLERAAVPFTADTLLPGGVARLRLPWPPTLAQGDYRADVALESVDALTASPEVAPITEKSAATTIRDQPLSAPAPRGDVTSTQGIVGGAPAPRAAPARALELPWWTWYAVGLGALLLAGNGALAVHLLRRRR